MRKKNGKPRLTRRILINMLLATVLSIGILGFLWLHAEYSGFQREIQTMRGKFLASYKDVLRSELAKAVSYIDYQKTLVRSQLMNSVKGRVYEAHAIAQNLFNRYHDKKTPAEMREMIKDALRPIRFNEGRGYFFAFNMEGIETLFADRPEMEGKNMLSVQGGRGEYVVRDMLDIVNRAGEGFYEYTWTKPDRDGHFPKIAFVKAFEPLGWVIGSGEYLDDVEYDIQKKVIRFIEQIHYGKGGYIFAGRYDGISLSGPAKGLNMWNVTDRNGRKIVQELIRLAKGGGGYFEYVMPRLEDKRPAPKLAYVIGVPEWQWYVGTGVYIDEIEKTIEQRRAVVGKEITEHIVKIGLVLAGLVLLVLLAALTFSRRIAENIESFATFFRRSAVELDEIDPAGMNFVELQDLSASANDMIKARKKAEDALRASESRYRILFESANDAIFLIKDGRFVDCNKRAVEMFAAPREVILGSTPYEWSPVNQPDGRDSKEKAREKLLEANQDESRLFEWLHQRKNGETFYAEVSLTKIHMQEGPHALAIVRDIAERKNAEKEKERLETQLIQAQKMEAIGTLAGGIAHDFNNILFPMLGYVEMLLNSLQMDETQRKWMLKVQEGGDRAKELVKQILAISRKVETTARPVTIPLIIDEVVGLLKSTLPSFVEIETRIDPGCGDVLADPTHIHQILMNLATNAYHAMEGKGGRLAIVLDEVKFDASDFKDASMPPGQYAHLAFSDTGSGMTPDVLDRIFDPYFTTKGMGKGTGLGLAVVHGLVKKYGGGIWVDSERGRGTVFHVYLPVIEKREQEPAGDETDQEARSPAGTEHILAVDDEKHIRSLLQDSLQALGYRVDVCSNGMEALELFRKDPASFDMVITDMTMPRMNGLDLGERILEIRPDMPIILLTGFSTPLEEKRILKAGIRVFAMKPISPREIALLMRKLLDE